MDKIPIFNTIHRQNLHLHLWTNFVFFAWYLDKFCVVLCCNSLFCIIFCRNSHFSCSPLSKCVVFTRFFVEMPFFLHYSLLTFAFFEPFLENLYFFAISCQKFVFFHYNSMKFTFIYLFFFQTIDKIDFRLSKFTNSWCQNFQADEYF